MRSEDVIFQDLSAVCTSHGYVHALAYLCFRDSVIRYSDDMRAENMDHLFSMEHLIRTERSTLIGLMVQQEIDWSLPDAKTIQQHIDETERLLKELHESMSEPMIESYGSPWNPAKKSIHSKKEQICASPSFTAGSQRTLFSFATFLFRNTKPMIHG